MAEYCGEFYILNTFQLLNWTERLIRAYSRDVRHSFRGFGYCQVKVFKFLSSKVRKETLPIIMLATVLTKRNRCNFWQEFFLVPHFASIQLTTSQTCYVGHTIFGDKLSDMCVPWQVVMEHISERYKVSLSWKTEKFSWTKEVRFMQGSKCRHLLFNLLLKK